MNVLMPGHPDWQEFRNLIEDGLDPQCDADGVPVTWNASPAFRYARAACRQLGLTDQETDASEAAWREAGLAHCDVEILLNLPDDDEDDDTDADLEPVAPLATLTR